MIPKTKKEKLILIGDFETTVYVGQDHTEVWASALVPLNSEDVVVLHSIDETLQYLIELKRNVIVYYHNLKFDGSFWLDFLLKLGFENAIDPDTGEFIKASEMKNSQMSYLISDVGQWYKIDFKTHGHVIELRDSLKLIPLSVKELGKAFKTKHQKLDMEYAGERYAGCTITDEEKQYIANDVLVVKEALEQMFLEGHNSLTIGSCCWKEFKNGMHEWINGSFDETFPNLYEFHLDPKVYGSENADEYIRKSYHGGWCYCARGKEKTVFHDGLVLDVNSLYPSMMSSESGKRYPYGQPTFWTGDLPHCCKVVPKEPWNTVDYKYYYVRIRCRFRIKPGYLPFIQIKHSPWYMGTDMLESSDIMINGKKTLVRMQDGSLENGTVTMTLSRTDYELFREHYDVYDLQILDGCYFDSVIGIFDRYINKYKYIKQHSQGGQRQIAKLFLNNLYGRLAASSRSDFKVAALDGSKVHYTDVPANDKKPGYIACGAAITSYARAFTIRAAQANYYGPDKPGFIYADTDSVHCDLPFDALKGVRIHETDFCAWKCESQWDVGWFVRQKTYIEHIFKEDFKECDPYYNIRCAGLPKRCKTLLDASLRGLRVDKVEAEMGMNSLTAKEREFVRTKRDLTDFKQGIIIPGKLIPKHIPGGVVLVDTDFEMR